MRDAPGRDPRASAGIVDAHSVKGVFRQLRMGHFSAKKQAIPARFWAISARGPLTADLATGQDFLARSVPPLQGATWERNAASPWAGYLEQCPVARSVPEMGRVARPGCSGDGKATTWRWHVDRRKVIEVAGEKQLGGAVQVPPSQLLSGKRAGAGRTSAPEAFVPNLVLQG